MFHFLEDKEQKGHYRDEQENDDPGKSSKYAILLDHEVQPVKDLEVTYFCVVSHVLSLYKSNAIRYGCKNEQFWLRCSRFMR